MAMKTELQTLSLVAVGSLLGYAAATIDLSGKATAAIATGSVRTATPPQRFGAGRLLREPARSR